MKNIIKTLSKKITCLLLLVVIVVLTFSGCSAQNKAQAAVDSEIASVTADESYMKLSDEEKAEKVEAKLDQLVKDGKVKENSVNFDEQNKIISFQYSDETLGAVSIKKREEDKYNGSSYFADKNTAVEQSYILGDSSNIETPSSINDYKKDPSYDTSLNSTYTDNSTSQSTSTAVIFNAFENTSYRRNYYNSLKTKWDKNNLTTNLDTDVTVDDLANISSYDVVVLAMHGTTYNGNTPVLCLNEQVTSKTDRKYAKQIKNKEIVRASYQLSATETAYEYWVTPKFFETEYAEYSMGAQLVFSESCMFFGCDCYSKSIDYKLGNAVKDASGGVVVGYHNSVLADYSRDVMSETVEKTMAGYSVSEALDFATEKYGDNDNYKDKKDDKYIAYPFICGDSSKSVTKIVATSFSTDDSINATVGEVCAIEPQILPEKATDYVIKWQSSNEDVATVSPEGENCIVTAKSKGDATITATMTSGGKEYEQKTNVTVYEKARDTGLVLDISGSMSTTPIEEMKIAAKNFCNDQLKSNANNKIGIIFYSSSVSTVDMTDSLDTLTQDIDNVYTDDMTNMTSAINAADDMLESQGRDGSIRNIVVMADGLPNAGINYSGSGEFSQSDYPDSSYESIAYANGVMDVVKSISSKYNIYSLGFFHEIYDDAEKALAVGLMKKITNVSDGYHQVDDASKLQFAFGDIQDTISDSSKIIINIACPVDASVTFNGETLSSDESAGDLKTSFGNVQRIGKNKDIKVMSLNAGNKYDIQLSGTGYGTMDYSVNYTDKDGKITDCRSFSKVPLTKASKITTNTDNKSDVALNIDNNGDGNVDSVWTASKNSSAKDPNATEEKEKKTKPKQISSDSSKTAIIIVCASVAVVLLITVIIIIVFVKKNRKKDCNTAPNVGGSVPVAEINNGNMANGETHMISLVLHNSPYEANFTLSPGETVTVGRDSNNSKIALPGTCKRCARMHCTISYSERIGKFVVEDLSTNGIWDSFGNRLKKGTNYLPSNSSIKLPDEVILNLKTF